MEPTPNIFFVDIDNTICNTTGIDYKHAEPIVSRIEIVNQLHRKGNAIIYWTGRGVAQGIDYTDLTGEQLEEWGCEYDKLRLDKPIWDYLIDDRAVNPAALTDPRKKTRLFKGWHPW